MKSTYGFASLGRSALFAAGIHLGTLFQIPVATAQVQPPEVPLEPGQVTYQPLTEAQRRLYMEFTTQTRRILNASLLEASRLNYRDQLQVYSRAIHEVMAFSLENHGWPELVTRLAIYQGLKLTVGFRQEMQIVPGILSRLPDGPLLTQILKTSIELALSELHGDEEAIKGGDILDLKLDEYGLKRLYLGRQWLRGVMLHGDNYTQLFLRTLLEQWLEAVRHPLYGRDLALGWEIRRIDSALQITQPSTGFLLGELQWLIGNLGARFPLISDPYPSRKK
jgi:hypothetical protein